MDFDYYKYRISAHFGSALINDDWTGLNEADTTALCDFLESVIKLKGHFDLVDWESEGFFGVCDITGLYSDCMDVRFYFPIEASA